MVDVGLCVGTECSRVRERRIKDELGFWPK